jgi:hypothetical protein
MRSTAPGVCRGQLDQVLLERFDTERVFDVEVGGLAIGAVGADQEFAIALEERGLDTRVSEFCVGEIAARARLVRRLHRNRML